MAGPSDGDPDGWVEFCERQAKTCAQDFARAYLQYIQTNLADTVARPISQKEVTKKFIECFSEHFDYEFGKLKVQHKLPNGTHTGHDDSDYSEDTGSPKAQHKPFFRRLSFKGLRRKGLFHKQHSDEVELASSLNKHNKTKLAKIVVECRKEGLVNYLTPESLEQPGVSQKWEKCRLALIKTVGGYMLEFYSPPKSQKPRSGVFCFLISEARETTALEMPDHENTFVLKADNNMEYVIDALDVDDMKSWLATIKYCMRSAPTAQPPPEALASLSEPAPPDLPPRRDLPASASNTNLNLETPDEGELGSIAEEVCEPERGGRMSMAEWPWFHGTLARAAAASCVLSGGQSAHGCYLVRQSETRRGEYVLTFNFQGRAKHLRMTLSDAGQCRVQHLWFPDVHEMLDHFRVHPIPLESGGTADVTLTEYVVCHDPARPHLSVSHGSDVRMHRGELEALMAASGPPRDIRAVDNQYVLCATRASERVSSERSTGDRVAYERSLATSTERLLSDRDAPASPN